ncbi:hypothetical protein MLD38_016642 [Melastoma candidum]|uniref:Uncharacterized protein n=1 Tax=Melastoma candidum TaxID=119954 RepID=A0ACB9QNL5_9MYRT|nr:hypothetical protein MLD38_016642 [Melastoma candidum]
MCTEKSMLVVNGSFPGPVIRVQKGDTAYVTVHNNGTYNVTIHWHGVMQPRNPWSDGPEYVTQCPIPVGTSFTQEVILSEEEGTLWWHAHSDWTRATVHGAIIIEPADGSNYPFKKPDGEEIIVLADWFDGDVMTIMDTGLITGAAFTESTAFLINGLPGALYNCSASGMYTFYSTP